MVDHVAQRAHLLTKSASRKSRKPGQEEPDVPVDHAREARQVDVAASLRMPLDTGEDGLHSRAGPSLDPLLHAGELRVLSDRLVPRPHDAIVLAIRPQCGGNKTTQR